MDGFTHEYEDVNGVRLHYVIGGRGDPVVLLHGWPLTWYEWRHITPDLAKQYTVIAPDLRGPGESSVPEQGRERVYFSYFFKAFAHKPDAVPDEDLEAAVEAYSRPGRLKAGFAHYRAMPESAKQNAELMKHKLTMPVLAVGGEACFGDIPGQQMKLVADDVTTVSLEECGHWVTAEQPAAFLKELLAFLSDE